MAVAAVQQRDLAAQIGVGGEHAGAALRRDGDAGARHQAVESAARRPGMVWRPWRLFSGWDRGDYARAARPGYTPAPEGGESMRTQVGIVGAGPAGLLLSHLLHLQGIESVVLEARSRDYVENRIRAGVLEYGTEQLLNDSGVGERMRREGMLHPGVVMRFERADHRIDFADLVGKHVMVYSQHKVVQDLIAARLAAGGPDRVRGGRCRRARLSDRAARASVTGMAASSTEMDCDIIAGCDGFHGVCRPSIPAGVLRVVRARLSVRLAGHPGRGAAIDRRECLCQS